VARIEEVLAGEESWGKYWLDVLGHAGYGAGLALPIIGLCLFFLPSKCSPVYALAFGAGAALLGGVLREVYQFVKSKKLHLLDRILDALAFPLGAPIALGIALLIQKAL